MSEKLPSKAQVDIADKVIYDWCQWYLSEYARPSSTAIHDLARNVLIAVLNEGRY